VLILVRHGRTEANASVRLQGRLDLPLDDVGIRQVTALAGAVSSPARVISSPAWRARQTAEVFGLPVDIDDRWQEMSYGALEGCAIADIQAATWSRWMTDLDYAPEGGETLRDLGTRVRSACEELVDAARHDDIVVVTHATPIKAAMAWALGVDVSITWRSFVDQASITRIIVRDRGPALASFNSVPWT